MPAKSPEEICELFREAMARGDVEAVLDVYDPAAVFASESGEVTHGRDGLRAILTPVVARKPRFEYEIKMVVRAADVALMHTAWNVPGDAALQSYAIEVARQQPDGTWRWLIGDPFTIGREFGPSGPEPRP